MDFFQYPARGLLVRPVLFVVRPYCDVPFVLKPDVLNSKRVRLGIRAPDFCGNASMSPPRYSYLPHLLKKHDVFFAVIVSGARFRIAYIGGEGKRGWSFHYRFIQRKTDDLNSPVVFNLLEFDVLNITVLIAEEETEIRKGELCIFEDLGAILRELNRFSNKP